MNQLTFHNTVFQLAVFLLSKIYFMFILIDEFGGCEIILLKLS
jgi:hypothetical protein